ncbi:MAG: hypothetical protein OEU54_04755 [Gemmatimonadota bacterium]|nr:hypothetical protein [Gemmatimonadota bacterium]
MRSLSSRRKCVLAAVPLLLWVTPGNGAAQQDSRAVQPEIRALLNTSLPDDVGAHDGATQYMMIDVFDITLSGPGSGGDGALGLSSPPAGGSWYLTNDEAGNALVVSGPHPDAAAAPVLAGRGTGRSGQEVGVKGFLRSLGESTGKAFQLQMNSDGPIRFNGSGIVVEPLVIRDQARLALEQEITQLAARNPVTRVLNAYCLEFLKQPPSMNQVFRIAEEQLQIQYAPAANILKAGRKLIEDGVFKGHPLDYVHSVKQWALWVHEGEFSFEQFSDRFLAHAEDNFTVAGLAWSEQIASLVGMSLEGRWQHIDQVLTEAGTPPLRSGESR